MRKVVKIVMKVKKNKMKTHARSVTEPSLLAVTSKAGISFARICNKQWDKNNSELEGALMSVITIFFKEQFNSNLEQIACEDHLIFIKSSKNFITYILVQASSDYGKIHAEPYMHNLLSVLEKLYEKNNNIFEIQNKLKYLIYDYYYHYLSLSRKN